MTTTSRTLKSLGWRISTKKQGCCSCIATATHSTGYKLEREALTCDGALRLLEQKIRPHTHPKAGFIRSLAIATTPTTGGIHAQ
jgi:hypothetical protein